MNLSGKRVIMNNMTENFLNFDDALSSLETLTSNSFLTDAWIPSLNKTVQLKELTAKQQMTLIENFFDAIENKITFSKTFFNIILENCLEDSLVIDDLTIIDKASLAFFIRNQLSDKLKVEFQENPKIEHEIETNTILEKFKSFSHPTKETIQESEGSMTIEVQIEVPKMKQENDFDLFIFEKTKIEDEFENFKTVIGNSFLGELAKEIKINNNLFNYKELSVDNKIKVVEKLPIFITKKIIEKINVWKIELEKLCTVKHENLEKTIKIDALLFLIN